MQTDTFSSAFSAPSKAHPFSAEVASQGSPVKRSPWELGESREEDQIQMLQPSQSQHPFWPQRVKQPRLDLQTSMDSEHSSLTEEVFANALGNRCDSEPDQVSFCGEKSPQHVGAKRSFHADSTQDECSFYSQARSDLTFNMSADKKTPPFKTGPSAFGFMSDVNAPVFQPSAFVFHPPTLGAFPEGAPREFVPGPHAPPTGALSAEEADIVRQAEALAFDQAGCRMI